MGAGRAAKGRCRGPRWNERCRPENAKLGRVDSREEKQLWGQGAERILEDTGDIKGKGRGTKWQEVTLKELQTTKKEVTTTPSWESLVKGRKETVHGKPPVSERRDGEWRSRAATVFKDAVEAYHSLVAKLCPTLCDAMDTGEPARDSPGKDTGVGCHFLLQGIFWTQGSNLCLLHWQVILYHWVTWEAHYELGEGKLWPRITGWHGVGLLNASVHGEWKTIALLNVFRWNEIKVRIWNVKEFIFHVQIYLHFGVRG